jgi:hypothetical protein
MTAGTTVSSQMADSQGYVGLSWIVPRNTTTGTATVKVSCGTNANATVTIEITL